jgi:hypothetical protein
MGQKTTREHGNKIKVPVELTNLLVKVVGELYNKHNLPGSSPGYTGVHQPTTFYDSGRFKADPLPSDIGMRTEIVSTTEKEAIDALNVVLRMNADRDRELLYTALLRQTVEMAMRKRIDAGLTTQDKGNDIQIGEVTISQASDSPLYPGVCKSPTELVIRLDLQALLDLGVREPERTFRSGWGREHH